MKKLLTICLIIATVFTVNAQDGKPTKEETVAFIKSYFVDFKIAGWHNGEFNKWTDNYKIDFSESILTMEWSHYDWTGKLDATFKYEFDIKDISNLNVVENKENDFCENGISFNTLNKKSSIKFTEGSKVLYVNKFDISIFRGTDCISDVTQTTIYKAFNHLRKLCGAPDPISFD